MLDKDYVFDYDNRTYRIFINTLILNGFDAFLLEVNSKKDYDDYLAAHRVEDNTWYRFAVLGEKDNSFKKFEGSSQTFLNDKLDYVKANDLPPIEEQSYIHRIRSAKFKEALHTEHYSKVAPEAEDYFDRTQYPVKLNDTPSKGIKDIFGKLK